jgi:transcriptional regulator
VTQFKWAVTDEVIGEADVVVAGATATNIYAIWDSTTKFIWMKNTHTTAFISSLLAKKSITCTSGNAVKEVVTCPCTKASDIGDLKIKFNNQKDVHVIKNADFVTFDKTTKTCTLAVRAHPTEYVVANVIPTATPAYDDVIILGQPAFKSMYARFN